FGFSLLGSFLGTYLSKPTEMQVLKSFYSTVHPWGWWKPVLEALKKEGKPIEKNNEFLKDMLNCGIGIIWQSSMIVLPIYFMIRDYPKAGVALAIFVMTSVVLKYTWLDRVRKIPN
ncbi:MAG: sodium:solute symporter, partial [Maribacter sp.]|nr:sodium:solute symporter [Maribacter sp.]